jgi:hypothetical protein
MLKVIASFLLGVTVASLAFLGRDALLKGESASDSPISAVAERGMGEGVTRERNSAEPVLSLTRADGVVAGVDAEDATTGNNVSMLSTEPMPQAQVTSPFQELADLMRRTPESIERTLERSFNVLSDTPDRHLIFQNETQAGDLASTALEGIVVNEAWNTASNEFPPISIESECRESACRVRFAFGSNEEFVANAHSPIVSRMLVALEEYGFEAVDERIGTDDHGETFDVYLWRIQQ